MNVASGEVNIILGNEIIEHHLGGILVVPMMSRAKLPGQDGTKMEIVCVV